MGYREIARRPATTDSHPFVADSTIYAAAYDDYERAMQDRSEVKLPCRIDRPRLLGSACRLRGREGQGGAAERLGLILPAAATSAEPSGAT